MRKYVRNMKWLLLILAQTLWMTGFSQSLPFQDRGALIPSTNLVVRWKAAKHPWPENLWVYDMTRTTYSPAVISNLMAIGSFTEKDIDPKYTGTNGMTFSREGRVMSISYSLGVINYWITPHYGPTNLAYDVPGTNQLLGLTTNLLARIGITTSELVKDATGQPALLFPESSTEYDVGNSTITNIQQRIVEFRRSLDGVEYGGAGGYGIVAFGEHNQVVGILLHWPSVKQDKLYPAATPKQIAKWIQEGRAYYTPAVSSGGEAPIDWHTVKKLTIKKAQAYYIGEDFFGNRAQRPILPSHVRPYAGFMATIDTGVTNFDVGIRCPVIVETQP